MINKTCPLILLLLLFLSTSACATIPRQCNYARPHANYSEDRYRCHMLAEIKPQNTSDPRRMGGMAPLWQSDCMSQMDCR